MKHDLQVLIDQFLNILHLYSVINRKPKDYGTGDLLYFTEIHTIATVGKNREINVTRLADLMGVTKGAISQTIRKLMAKGLICRAESSNRKEVSLCLTARGMTAFRGQETFRREIFDFGAALYDKASDQDVDLVNRLFTAISENMQYRMGQM